MEETGSIERAQRLAALQNPEAALLQLARECVALAGGAGLLASLGGRGAGGSLALAVAVDARGEALSVSPAVRISLSAFRRRTETQAGPIDLSLDDQTGDFFTPVSTLLGRTLEGGRAYPLSLARHAGVLVTLGPEAPGATAEVARLVRFAQVILENALRHSAARRAEERLRLFDGAVEEAIWDLDVQSGGLWWGVGLMRLLKRPLLGDEGTLGWKLSRVHPDDEPRVRRSLEASIRSPSSSSWREHYRFLRKGGDWAEVEDRGYFLRDGDGEVYRVVGAMRDVTDLAQTIRLRDDFLSVASHELKTPLTPLQLQIEDLSRRAPALAKDASSAELLRRRAQMMRKQIDRLQRLIGGLLDLSRLGEGRMPVELEEVDAGAIARQVVRGFADQIAQSGSEVRVAVEPGLMGLWDPLRIEQILNNLLSNALKYGQGTPIDLILRREGEHAVFEVRDQGLGIAPEHQERIFGRFERAVSVRHCGGLGLGLFTARQIAEAHLGTITLESQPGEGARFVVRLPLGPDPEAFAAPAL